MGAFHLAEIGGWSFTNCARGLATSSDVVVEQLPLIVRDDFDVGAVTIRANDLQLEWDAERFEANRTPSWRGSTRWPIVWW